VFKLNEAGLGHGAVLPAPMPPTARLAVASTARRSTAPKSKPAAAKPAPRAVAVAEATVGARNRRMGSVLDAPERLARYWHAPTRFAFALVPLVLTVSELSPR